MHTAFHGVMQNGLLFYAARRKLLHKDASCLFPAELVYAVPGTFRLQMSLPDQEEYNR